MNNISGNAVRQHRVLPPSVKKVEKQEPQETKAHEPETNGAEETQVQTPQKAPEAPQTIGTASYLAQKNIQFISLNNLRTLNTPEGVTTIEQVTTPVVASEEGTTPEEPTDETETPDSNHMQTYGFKDVIKKAWNWFKKNWRSVLTVVGSIAGVAIGGACFTAARIFNMFRKI